VGRRSVSFILVMVGRWEKGDGGVGGVSVLVYVFRLLLSSDLFGLLWKAGLEIA
jgi:hypothetical protein